jgi:hypothetical protein
MGGLSPAAERRGLRLWDTGTGRSMAVLRGHPGAVWGVSWSADGEPIATCGTDGTVRLWDTRTGYARPPLLGHTGAVSAVSLSADGKLVASGNFDGTVRRHGAVLGRAEWRLRARPAGGAPLRASGYLRTYRDLQRAAACAPRSWRSGSCSRCTRSRLTAP